MTSKRPHHDTIIAWAEGKTVQCWCHGRQTWYDWDCGGVAPPFHPDKEYRVKPETIRYRTYLRKASCGGYYVENVTEAANKMAPRETWEQFVRWLGDWQEVEI